MFGLSLCTVCCFIDVAGELVDMSGEAVLLYHRAVIRVKTRALIALQRQLSSSNHGTRCSATTITRQDAKVSLDDDLMEGHDYSNGHEDRRA